jgi:hypothetical protein
MASVNETRICVAVSILCDTTAIFYRHPTDFARRGRCPACCPTTGIRGERRISNNDILLPHVLGSRKPCVPIPDSYCRSICLCARLATPSLPRLRFVFLHLNSQSDTDPQVSLPTTTESTRTTNPSTALDTEKFLLDPWLSCVVGWVRHMAL